MPAEKDPTPEQPSSPSELVPISLPEGDVTLQNQIEARLVRSNSPQEAIQWTQVRGEILSQDEMLKEGSHRRSIERIQIIRRTGLAVSALIVGTILIIKGLTTVGMFVLGAGLYELNQDFLKLSWPGKGADDDNR